MKHTSGLIAILITVLFISLNLFCDNDMGKGRSYDGYSMTETGIIDLNNFTYLDPELSIADVHLSNFPNPFNPSTTISFQISNEQNQQNEQNEQRKLIIYNLKGQKIRQYSIFNNQSSIVWDGTDQTGQFVSSGIYFYRLKSGNIFSETKRMLLLK